jgi:hypothetical protein
LVWKSRCKWGFFFLLGRNERSIYNLNNGTGYAKIVFVIGRALKGQVDNEERSIFGIGYSSDIHIGPANQALHFCNFQLQSYRKAVDCWTIMGLRNRVVKDIRKMIGKMIWEAREDAEFELNCNSLCQCPFCVVMVEEESDSSEQSSDEEESDSSEQSSGEEDDENFDE